jgi:hypothetical protein
MQVWRMRTGISIFLKPVDRRRLSTVVRDRNAPHKHVWRAEIVLLSADGVGTNEIMRRTGKSKTAFAAPVFTLVLPTRKTCLSYGGAPKNTELLGPEMRLETWFEVMEMVAGSSSDRRQVGRQKDP